MDSEHSSAMIPSSLLHIQSFVPWLERYVLRASLKILAGFIGGSKN